MEQFKRTHPDYESYSGTHYEVKKVPKELVRAIEGLIVKHCKGNLQLKNVVNVILTNIPEPPTQNWGGDWLIGDLSNAIAGIAAKPLPRFMDALGAVVEMFPETDFESELEELFKEHRFGYNIESGPGFDSYWELRDEQTRAVAAAVDETKVAMRGICEQALLHLEQTKSNLKKEDERSRKDAVRDALSAMEAMYKQLSGKPDINDAYKALRDQKTWGPDAILKDGYSIWQQVHHLYPDIRHGQASGSSLSEEETQYWIERILAFLRHMARKHD